MYRKLKTVPLKELFGDSKQRPPALRIGILLVAVVDAVVLGVLLWRLLH